MTLRYKFTTEKSISTSGESARFARECEKIADDYAVEFYKFTMSIRNDRNYWHLTASELLEMFKKEKGL